jgi:hypothetical protein
MKQCISKILTGCARSPSLFKQTPGRGIESDRRRVRVRPAGVGSASECTYSMLELDRLLYLEQDQGRKLAILDATDPANIRAVGHASIN